MKSTAMLTREAALAGRRWYVIDARDQVLGRVASEAAKLLRGKGNPAFSHTSTAGTSWSSSTPNR